MVGFVSRSLVFTVMLGVLASCAVQNAETDPLLGNTAAIEQKMISGARDYYEAGEYKKAADAYAKILGENASRQSWFYYAESLRLSGEYDKAVIRYKKLLQASRKDSAVREAMAMAYLGLGDLDNAQRLLYAVMDEDASSWRSANALGVISTLRGDKKEALKYYQTALKISRNNPSIINNIGLSMLLSGDIDVAIGVLQRALQEVGSEDGDAKRKKIENNLALAYGVKGDIDKAEKILSRNMSKHAVYNNLGFYAKMANDSALAKTYLSKALASSPVHYDKAWENLQNLE